jgi:hypothetical protein
MARATQAAKNRRAARRNAKAAPAASTTVHNITNNNEESITMSTTTTRRTRKPAAKAAPTVKTTTVKLKGTKETQTTWQFTFAGTSKTPLVKTVYINKDALDMLADGPLTVVFAPFVPSDTQRPQPKSAIRYTGDPETIRDLYMVRGTAEKAGFTNDSTVTVIVKVVSDDEISLSISAA